MGKGLRRVLLTVWILAGILAGWQSIQKSRVPLDSLLGFCMARDGKTIAGWYEGNDTIIARTDKGGVAEGTYRYRTVKGSRMYTVRGMASGENYTYVPVSYTHLARIQTVSNTLLNPLPIVPLLYSSSPRYTFPIYSMPL